MNRNSEPLQIARIKALFAIVHGLKL